VDTLEVTTTIRVPPARAFAFLRDFEGYSQYSKYLQSIRSNGDGSEGTEYEIRFGWWKLTYGVKTAVTSTTPDERIEWEVERGVDARGHWAIEPVDGGQHSRVTFAVSYDPDSADVGGLDIPRLVSLDWIVDRVVGLIEEEGRRVVGRVVRDLEGESRPITLQVRHEPARRNP